jgi:hypothetical protein
MMGFGGTGMTVGWVFGGIAVAAIWIGVWWILASVGAAPGRSRPGPPRSERQARPAVPRWQQPRFAEPAPRDEYAEPASGPSRPGSQDQ